MNDQAVIEQDTGDMCVLDVTGDLKIKWSKDKPVEVDAARKTFNDMKAKGYSAFAFKKKGAVGRPITEFDPTMGAIVMAPRIVGG